MNTKVYRQYDSRWGWKPYPTKNSTVASDGCGLCAVTNCLIELPKWNKATPLTFWYYMVQYAVAGNGTRWDGIDAGLKAFGFKNVRRHDNMASFWNEVGKGSRVGVILFRSGAGPDGTVWTTGGHYVAFVDYKYQNGKHWLYTKDSGSRHNDGWHSYENSMRGRIALLWTAEIPYELDGVINSRDIRKLQKWMGVKEDGVLSNQLESCRKYLPAFATVCQFSKNPQGGSATVRALQTYLDKHRYSPGAIDGYAGKHLISSLQRFLNKQGFNCGRPDGVAGPKTANALKGFLYSF